MHFAADKLTNGGKEGKCVLFIYIVVIGKNKRINMQMNPRNVLIFHSDPLSFL